jgi:mRNA-degrading endonuclease HigB of HigAB toxin-antitoxin module
LQVTNKYILVKLKKKNLGNVKLGLAIDRLVDELERGTFETPNQLLEARPDADQVYGGNFYFFDIHVHRAMVLVEFGWDGEASIVWAGSHDEYEITFKNNKNAIRKWLKNHGWI